MENDNSTTSLSTPDFFQKAINEYRENPKGFNDYIDKLKISAPGQAAGILSSVLQAVGKEFRDK